MAGGGKKLSLSCQKRSYLLSKADRIALQGLHLFLFRMSLLCNAEGLLHALQAYSYNLYYAGWLHKCKLAQWNVKGSDFFFCSCAKPHQRLFKGLPGS